MFTVEECGEAVGTEPRYRGFLVRSCAYEERTLFYTPLIFVSSIVYFDYIFFFHSVRRFIFRHIADWLENPSLMVDLTLFIIPDILFSNICAKPAD